MKSEGEIGDTKTSEKESKKEDKKTQMEKQKKVINYLDDFEKQKKNEIKEVFNIYDSNKTGFITGESMKICFKALGIRIKNKEIAPILKEMFDKDIKEKFKLEEFYKVAKKVIDEQDPDQEMKNNFNLLCDFDDDNSEGKSPPVMDKEFIKNLAESVGETLNQDEINEMVEIVGGKKKKISRDNFIAFMKSPLTFNSDKKKH